MPKDRRLKSPSFDRATVSPYGHGVNMSDSKSRLPAAVQEKEWEEARCPICMEIPHNAVLLICSSPNCRPFICDTSPRHSNCLDQFKKSPGAEQNNELVCPLCRGAITVWTVVEEARKLMNAKIRSCSLETCDFSGNYTELRKHARREHPFVHPSEVSPTRQSNWAELQRQMDLEDVLAHQYIDSEWVDGILLTPTATFWDDLSSFDFNTEDESNQSLDGFPPTPTPFSWDDGSSFDVITDDEEIDLRLHHIISEFTLVSSEISRFIHNSRRLNSNGRVNSTVVASPSLGYHGHISPSSSIPESPSHTSRDESRSRRSNDLNRANPYSRARAGYLTDRRNRSSTNQTSRDGSGHRSFPRSTRSYDLSNADQSSNSRSRSSVNQTSRDGSSHRSFPRYLSSRYHNADTSSNSRNRSSINQTSREGSSHRSFPRSTRSYDLSNAGQSSNSRSRSSINQTNRDGSSYRSFPWSISSGYHNADTSSTTSRNTSSGNPVDRNPTDSRD